MSSPDANGDDEADECRRCRQDDHTTSHLKDAERVRAERPGEDRENNEDIERPLMATARTTEEYSTEGDHSPGSRANGKSAVSSILRSCTIHFLILIVSLGYSMIRYWILVLTRSVPGSSPSVTHQKLLVSPG